MDDGNTLPQRLPDGAVTPLVPLVVDPNDGDPMDHPDPVQNLFAPYGLSPALTDEQEALLGCGPFYGTNCDIDGIDLMNIEASSPAAVLVDLRRDLRAGHLGHQGREPCPARHRGLSGRTRLHALRGWQDLHPARLPGAR